jgi:hypothetical protein|tara:strand:- start:11 stop:313 length:303 start_codon:yes stop_codon:yes gene_type:complete
MQTINKEQAKQLINENKNAIFSATFTKKDGTNRLITARLGVKKGLKENAKPRPYDPNKYNLLCVYDMALAKQQQTPSPYRMLNLKTLLTLNINKTKYIIR